MALYKRVPTQIVVAAYHKEDGAEKALEALVEAMKDEAIVCSNVAIITKNEKGKVKVKELGKPGFVKGLIGGGASGQAAGAAIGGSALSLLGPIGVGAGAFTGGLVGGAIGSVKGAVIGSAGKVTVEGMDKSKLSSVGSALLLTTSALIAVFSEVVVSKQAFKKELKIRDEGADQINEMLDASITEELEKEKDVAFHLVILEDGAVMTQVTKACFATDFKQIIIKPDAATAKHVTVSPDGDVTESAAIVTPEGEAVVAGEGVAGAAATITTEAVEYEA